MLVFKSHYLCIISLEYATRKVTLGSRSGFFLCVCRCPNCTFICKLQMAFLNFFHCWGTLMFYSKCVCGIWLTLIEEFFWSIGQWEGCLFSLTTIFRLSLTMAPCGSCLIGTDLLFAETKKWPCLTTRRFLTIIICHDEEYTN